MWILLALGSNFSWAIENVYTKAVIGSKIKNPYVFLILISVLSILILPFVQSKYIVIPPGNGIWWLWLASFFYTVGGFPYVKAMEIEEVTRINILWNTIPLFSLVLAWFVIGDRISGMEFVAMLLLLAGAVVGSLKKSKSKFKLSLAFWLMMLACVMYAAYALVVRYISKTIPFPTIFFWVVLFDAITILVSFVFRKIRYDFTQTIKSNSLVFFGLFLVVVMIGNLGIFLNQWALSLKAGALVYSFEGFQVLFVFFLALLIAKFSPIYIAESLDRKNLLLKLLAFVLIMGGLVILSL
ncbi:MAG: hypothetical protein ACD_72C00100G0003 [uncultured bacterium]|nr:MAG: hypothetical protein ACD_72C00100G0003 [uncultured bacterium]